MWETCRKVVGKKDPPKEKNILQIERENPREPHCQGEKKLPMGGEGGVTPQTKTHFLRSRGAFSRGENRGKKGGRGKIAGN